MSGLDESARWRLWYSSVYKTPSGESTLRIYRSCDQDLYWFKYQDGTAVYIGENASRIWITWPPHYSVEDAATYLFGPVMAILAQLRNKTCLHASAVAVDGRAIVLLGDKGAGKSTSAAALARAGYPVVADDLVILSEQSGQFMAEPGYPNLRLWSSSVEALFGKTDALPLLSPSWDKRGLDLYEHGYNFQGESLPIAALYVLCDRSDLDMAPWSTPSTGRAALMSLVRHSWGHYAQIPTLGRQLPILAKLSCTVPVRDITPHLSLSRISDLCRILVDDVRSIRVV